MITELSINYEGINDDGSRQADELRRTIMDLYPNAVWEKLPDKYGHRIIIPD